MSPGHHQPSNGQSGCIDASTGHYVQNGTIVDVTVNPNSIAPGFHHTCVILENGSVSCWGRNYRGELGDGSIGENDGGQTGWRSTPSLTQGFGNGRTAVSIASGNGYSCVILNDGNVSCWGNNEVGQLGDGSKTNRPIPTQTLTLGPGRTAVAITAGDRHTCAILDDGNVSCWGYNDVGQLGDGATDQDLIPV